MHLIRLLKPLTFSLRFLILIVVNWLLQILKLKSVLWMHIINLY